MSRTVEKLRDMQAMAADPAAHAWVSASAGTGKTQVLTARVLRLLLGDVRPDRILCLTFTRAAAAEMQDRVYDILAGWLHADDISLVAQLEYLGVTPDAAACLRARQLFATVLDARGGLRIQTLHSYAQSLLASFPLEAGIAPGFRLMDDRTGAELRHRALVTLIEDAERAGARDVLDDLAALAIRLGEARVHDVTAILLRHAEAIQALGPIDAIDTKLRSFLGLPLTGSADDVLAEAVSDGAFDEAGLRAYALAMADWNTKTGLGHADAIRDWLMASPAGRVTGLAALTAVFLKQDGDLRKLQGKPAKDEAVVALQVRLADWLSGLADTRRRFDLLDHAGVHLRIGWRLAAVFARDKARTGGLAFDDMISGAARLLDQPGMADWVRYKLDQSIDHILVDEAQDTNADQWAIINALAEPFFAGQGAVDRQRTLFAVGDFKQAIFSFQGTDPAVFADAQKKYHDLAAAAQADFRPVPLSESFRSTAAVLALVDKVIEIHGGASMGLDEVVPPHDAARGGLPGRIVLWDAVRDLRKAKDKDADGDGAGGADPDGGLRFVPDAQTMMAQKLAAQIAAWLDSASPERLWLGARGDPRYAAAGDILILVRKRGNFVPALVAELHKNKVPIAGVDRLRLVEPIGVQDCLSLIRFALQPGDDLALATLLTSPFIGWDQDQLFTLAHGRKGSLWRTLRAAETPHGQAAKAWLGRVLDLADYTPPYEFLETILSGPLEGRVRLLKRLGEEARDAIDTLVTQALAFEADHPPSLQGFLNWIESDASELKRDPEAAGGAVRIMTVHGAKGLQAPVVVLADAATEKDVSRASHAMVKVADVTVPIFADSKMRSGAVAKAFDDAAEKLRAEDWRLLYVALTRAEDMLFIGGALGRKDEAPKKDSWHALLAPAFVALGADVQAHGLWGGQLCHDVGTVSVPGAVESAEPTPAAAVIAPAPIPAWALSPAPPESTPPRPLSPSQLGKDDSGAAPPSMFALRAAARGTLLHSLFEKLPAVATDRRAAVAARWLDTQACDFSADERDQMARDVLTVLNDPTLADIFGADALVEAPLTAVVGTQVIAGTVDRLCIGDSHVTVVDYKTGLAIPGSVEAVPRYYLIQMAAYRAALRSIFPGRAVRATLIYTAVPRRFDLPDELLDSVLASIEPERAAS